MKAEDCARAEADAVTRGDRLVAPEMLLERWGIAKKELRRLCAGTHPSGVRLPAIVFSLKTIRFRLADVLAAEHALYGRE